MTMKKEKRLSWSEVLKYDHRVLQIFFQRYPQVILSRFFSVLWSALTPYAGIWLAALIIDA